MAQVIKSTTANCSLLKRRNRKVSVDCGVTG